MALQCDVDWPCVWLKNTESLAKIKAIKFSSINILNWLCVYLHLVKFTIMVVKPRIGQYSDFTKEELMVIAIGEIIQELLKANQEGRDCNLNKVKSQISSKYGLPSSPKLVDIIAAVPLEHRKLLVPQLKAKPIRTASGVNQFTKKHICLTLYWCLHLLLMTDCCSCGHVQTPQMSSH